MADTYIMLITWQELLEGFVVQIHILISELSTITIAIL